MEHIIGYVNFVVNWLSHWGPVILTAGLIYFTYSLWRAAERYVESTKELIEESKNQIEALKELNNAIERLPGNLAGMIKSNKEQE